MSVYYIIKPLKWKKVSFVESESSTPQGIYHARLLSKELADAFIVSENGRDGSTIGHTATLEGAKHMCQLDWENYLVTNYLERVE
jgi:hypothetical protein